MSRSGLMQQALELGRDTFSSPAILYVIKSAAPGARAGRAARGRSATGASCSASAATSALQPLQRRPRRLGALLGLHGSLCFCEGNHPLLRTCYGAPAPRTLVRWLAWRALQCKEALQLLSCETCRMLETGWAYWAAGWGNGGPGGGRCRALRALGGQRHSVPVLGPWVER